MKRKKPLLSYLELRYAHKKLNFACKNFFSENVCLRTKLDLRLKLYGKHFFQKKIQISFFVTTLFNCSQKAAEMVYFFFYYFPKMYENCMASIFSIHLMYGIL